MRVTDETRMVPTVTVMSRPLLTLIVTGMSPRGGIELDHGQNRRSDGAGVEGDRDRREHAIRQGAGRPIQHDLSELTAIDVYVVDGDGHGSVAGRCRTKGVEAKVVLDAQGKRRGFHLHGHDISRKAGDLFYRKVERGRGNREPIEDTTGGAQPTERLVQRERVHTHREAPAHGVDACRKELDNGKRLIVDRKYPFHIDKGGRRGIVTSGQGGKGDKKAHPSQGRARTKPGAETHERYLEVY